MSEIPTETTDDQLAVPEDNQPGHHPAEEQDKPDGDAFVRRFEGLPDEPTTAERLQTQAAEVTQSLKDQAQQLPEKSRYLLAGVRRKVASSLRRLAVVVDAPTSADGAVESAGKQ